LISLCSQRAQCEFFISRKATEEAKRERRKKSFYFLSVRPCALCANHKFFSQSRRGSKVAKRKKNTSIFPPDTPKNFAALCASFGFSAVEFLAKSQRRKEENTTQFFLWYHCKNSVALRGLTIGTTLETKAHRQNI
jgi:hypothetical protein